MVQPPQPQTLQQLRKSLPDPNIQIAKLTFELRITTEKPAAASRPRKLIVDTTVSEPGKPKASILGGGGARQWGEINPSYDPIPNIGLNGGLAASR